MNLDPLFHPKSMAIFGISSKNFINPANIVFCKNLYSKQTKVYGISKTATEFQGHKIYASVKDLPEIPEIAVFAMSSSALLDVLEECLEVGIKGAICITSGFGEVGEEGEHLQNLLRERCLLAKFPLIGPNCVGVYCPPWVDTIFVPTERFYVPRKGNVAVISQSGGMILDQFFQNFAEFGRNIGVSAVVSIGNKAVIDEVDLLEYFISDPQTDVVCCYLEGFSPGSGRRFCELAVKSSKDIIMYLGGQTESSNIAIKSHTATLAVNNRVATAAFKQYSIIVSKTEAQMVCAVKVFSELRQMYENMSLDHFDGSGVVVLTQSGGHGVVCADLLDTHHLKLLEFTAEEQQQMRNVCTPLVQRIGSMHNPIDLTGSGLDDDVVAVLGYLIKNPRVKCIVEVIEKLHPTKPIVHFIPRNPKWDIIRGAIESIHLPCALTIEDAVFMVMALRDKCQGQLRKENRSKMISN